MKLVAAKTCPPDAGTQRMGEAVPCHVCDRERPPGRAGSCGTAQASTLLPLVTDYWAM